VAAIFRSRSLAAAASAKTPAGVARASTVQILRGENAGRSVTYTNVVRAINKLGDWIGQTATFDMPGAAGDGEGLQKGTPERPGAILRQPKDFEASGREKRPSSPRIFSLRASEFPAIGRYDAFRLPRSRHIEGQGRVFSRKAARSIDTPCLAKFFAVSPPF
jgi:hypothetical protein